MQLFSREVGSKISFLMEELIQFVQSFGSKTLPVVKKKLRFVCALLLFYFTIDDESCSGLRIGVLRFRVGLGTKDCGMST